MRLKIVEKQDGQYRMQTPSVDAEEIALQFDTKFVYSSIAGTSGEPVKVSFYNVCAYGRLN